MVETLLARVHIIIVKMKVFFGISHTQINVKVLQDNIFFLDHRFGFFAKHSARYSIVTLVIFNVIE